MSWGATAYTPIVTYNSPPFGFHEVINPTDFKTCNENPWISGERMKREIQDALKDAQAKRDVHGTYQDYEYGYDEDFKKMALQDQRDCRLNDMGIVEGFIGGHVFCLRNFLLIVLAFFVWKKFLS